MEHQSLHLQLLLHIIIQCTFQTSSSFFLYTPSLESQRSKHHMFKGKQTNRFDSVYVLSFTFDSDSFLWLYFHVFLTSIPVSFPNYNLKCFSYFSYVKGAFQISQDFPYNLNFLFSLLFYWTCFINNRLSLSLSQFWLLSVCSIGYSITGDTDKRVLLTDPR